MARYPSPQKTQRPKDLCTIEQAAWIANDAIQRYEARRRFLAPHRRLRRWLRARWHRLRSHF